MSALAAKKSLLQAQVPQQQRASKLQVLPKEPAPWLSKQLILGLYWGYIIIMISIIGVMLGFLLGETALWRRSGTLD